MADPFNGTWRINLERSKHYTASPPLHEVITFQVDGDQERYEVEYEQPGAPRVRMGYATTYNDGKWVPYTLLEVIGHPEGVPEGAGGFGGRRPGDAVGMVTSVKIDERTRLRLARNLDGEAQYVLQRRLAEDGRSYDSTMLTADGEISLVRVFEKVD
jgi:hypothetical protein